MTDCDIGVMGMAVMGQNLVLNMNDHGLRVAVTNRTASRLEEFMRGAASGREIFASPDMPGFVALLKKPRIVMLMIKAGQAVDEAIDALLPLLEPCDVLVDGGNSHFRDTILRARRAERAGLRYIGTGISGGELGARRGPSIMPGGSPDAWPLVKPIFQAIAARLDDGAPACEWIEKDGAGHYVKMVHNGIEYSAMQLIAEAYHLMKDALGMDHEGMAAVFREWNAGRLGSYLVEITAHILAAKDANGSPLVSHILDAAGQKGTGRWATESALELGVPLTLVTEAVFARSLSALKEERTKAEPLLPARAAHFAGEHAAALRNLESALYLASILSYAQGFMLLREATREFGWDLHYADIATIWRAGCIIRSALLAHVSDAFRREPHMENLLFDPFFHQQAADCLPGLRRVAVLGAQAGIPLPAHASALAFWDGFRSGSLPANLIQAQRDYFGSHTYERTDCPRGQFFHTDWTGEGGDVTASTYNA